MNNEDEDEIKMLIFNFYYVIFWIWINWVEILFINGVVVVLCVFVCDLWRSKENKWVFRKWNKFIYKINIVGISCGNIIHEMH